MKLGTAYDLIAKYQLYYSFAFKEDIYQAGTYNGYEMTFKSSSGSNPITNINLNRLDGYAEIIKNQPIKSINIKEYQYRSISTSEKTIYETTVECNGEETLVYDYGKPIGTQTYIIADNYSGLEILDARNHIYDKNNNLIYTPDYGGTLLEYSYAKIKYNGTIKFRVKQIEEYNEEVPENVINYNEDGKEIIIDNDLISSSNSRNLSNYLANYIYNNYSKNSIKFKYNGYPELELGNCVNVENKYSTEEEPLYDKVWVTKIESEITLDKIPPIFL